MHSSSIHRLKDMMSLIFVKRNGRRNTTAYRLSIALAGILPVLSSASAQEFAWPDVPKFGLGVGMTVCTIRATSLTDYVNTYALPAQKVSTWNIAGVFFVDPEFNLSKNISMKLEYAYLMNSHKLTDPFSGGQIEFSYGVHMPSVIMEYMYIGKGFFVKAGGGAGYAVAKLDQRFPSAANAAQSTAHGPVIVIEGSGETPLSERVFLTIGVGMRFSFAGNFHGGLFEGSDRNVSMNFISAGASLGAVYYF